MLKAISLNKSLIISAGEPLKRKQTIEAQANSGKPIQIQFWNNFNIQSVEMFQFVRRNYVRCMGIWQNKSPIEKWDLLCSVGIFVLDAVGVHTLTTCKITWFTYSSLIAMGSYVSISSYTMYYFISRNRVFDGLKCLCLSGTCIGVSKQIIITAHLAYWKWIKEKSYIFIIFHSQGLHWLFPEYHKIPFYIARWMDIWSQLFLR